MGAPRITHIRLLITGFVAVWMACTLAALAQVEVPASDPAASLRDRYAGLLEQLDQSSLQKGLYLESVESAHASRGDLYAVVGYPFNTISDALTNPESWCDALILHLNVKYCRPTLRGDHTVLDVAIGKKTEQPLSETQRVELTYNVAAASTDYMQVDLNANKGPLGTRDYHIALELIDLEGERAFLHVQYSYKYGFLARLAMGFYLATGGQSKVGFTMVDGDNEHAPHLVGGVRGALERNIMRYYLAIDAYLGSLETPAPERFDASLERWFTATERYAIQLHEVDHEAYVTMKRNEYLRQQILP